jgi:hypothetical protein
MYSESISFLVHGHHRIAKEWFEGIGPDGCSICRLPLQGFLRLASNPAVFKDETVTMDVAWACYDSLLEDERVYFMREPEALEVQWREYTRDRVYSHKVWNRLVEVKKNWDPHNLFRINQNIKP